MNKRRDMDLSNNAIVKYYKYFETCGTSSGGSVEQLLQLFDGNATIEFPYHYEQKKRKISGIVAIRDFFTNWTNLFHFNSVIITMLSTDKNSSFAKIEANGVVLTSHKPYHQLFFTHVHTNDNDKIVHMIELFNPNVLEEGLSSLNPMPIRSNACMHPSTSSNNNNHNNNHNNNNLTSTSSTSSTSSSSKPTSSSSTTIVDDMKKLKTDDSSSSSSNKMKSSSTSINILSSISSATPQTLTSNQINSNHTPSHLTHQQSINPIIKQLLFITIMNSKAIHYLCQKRAAVKWIENVLEISLDQNEDFVKLLVDGILLCRVIQAISPRLMPRISIPDPNAPKRTIMFKNSENISFFIQASIDMGIPRHKKFTLADLQQERPTYTNIRRVIECLEAVCKIANQDSQYDFSIEWPVLEASEQKFSEKEVHEAESLLAQFTIRENKRQEVIKKSQTQNGDFSVAATKNQLFQHIADQKKLYPDNSPKVTTNNINNNNQNNNNNNDNGDCDSIVDNMMDNNNSNNNNNNNNGGSEGTMKRSETFQTFRPHSRSFISQSSFVPSIFKGGREHSNSVFIPRNNNNNNSEQQQQQQQQPQQQTSTTSTDNNSNSNSKSGGHDFKSILNKWKNTLLKSNSDTHNNNNSNNTNTINTTTTTTTTTTNNQNNYKRGSSRYSTLPPNWNKQIPTQQKLQLQQLQQQQQEVNNNNNILPLPTAADQPIHRSASHLTTTTTVPTPKEQKATISYIEPYYTNRKSSNATELKVALANTIQSPPINSQTVEQVIINQYGDDVHSSLSLDPSNNNNNNNQFKTTTTTTIRDSPIKIGEVRGRSSTTSTATTETTDTNNNNNNNNNNNTTTTTPIPIDIVTPLLTTTTTTNNNSNNDKPIIIESITTTNTITFSASVNNNNDNDSFNQNNNIDNNNVDLPIMSTSISNMIPLSPPNTTTTTPTPTTQPQSQRSSLGFKASPIGAPSSPTISSHVPSPAAVAEKLKSSGLTTSSSSAPTTTAPPVTSVTSTASTVPKTVNVVTQTPVTVTSTATPTAVAPTSTTATTASSTTSTATVTTVPKSSTPGTSTPDPKQDRLSTELKAVIKIQRATRRWLERNRQRVRERDNAYRERITQEITKTEVEYLNRLIYLRDQPLKDLREAIAKGSPIISEEEIRAIFSELESIIAYNTQLLNELQVRCKHWKQDTLIGDIFVKFSRFLMIYSQYCINYGDCLEVLNVCKKQPKFKAFLNKLKEHNEEIRLRGLEDYLIRPIQRIPRYSLLIKDMINHTWASHPDYQSLENAYNSMNTVAEKMNEAKRNAENRMKLADIQEKLEGNSNDISAVVKAHRRFVKEGEFTEGMVKKKCALVLYLFNDILAVTRPSKSSGSFFGKQKTIRLQFESSYPLHKLRLKPLDDTPTCTNSFMISTSSEDRLVICASDKETKEDWIAAIIAEKADADKHEKEQEERITSSVSEKVADTKLKLEQQFAFRTSGQYAPVDPDNPGAAGSSSLEDLNVKTGKMSLREKRMKLVQESRSNRLSANVSLTDSGKEKQ
ncbi:pleckstrin domain-containing protein [Cavenderia fasciculata]|uniref:Pleckstrin domain-containing protein n=1 Tax=Cavenderia fasciculata TaxID=261658 RepID=F4QCB3_CACFS|nr:pleckstrin domain-containing protein [Cavenderia fasciculata]EGG14394.1 pleckstrin domain-containing protein [Cavenderia fasciculata]|eukprot:XP_004353803.1 pleckstrin domain-containing protein [Cavenderia fasciculata]